MSSTKRRADTYAQRAIPGSDAARPGGRGLRVSGLVEGRLLGALDAEVDEPACSGVGLYPLVLVSSLAPASAAARAGWSPSDRVRGVPVQVDRAGWSNVHGRQVVHLVSGEAEMDQ
jgi:hypothetical protein